MGAALSQLSGTKLSLFVLVACVLQLLQRRSRKSLAESRQQDAVRSKPPSDCAPRPTATKGTHPLLAQDTEIWICLDFEWTCDEGEHRAVRSEDGEIIEFAFAVYDALAGCVVCEGQYYCKNEKTPITKFCRDLTGITEETLKGAGTLADALRAFNEALAPYLRRRCCAVTHGSADLELMLPRNCASLGLEVPPVLRRYVDLREATQSHLAAQNVKKRGSTLKQICEVLGVEMMGVQHCGLDDSWMVLMATQALLKAGAPLRSVHLDEERQAFLNGQETRLCLDGVPFNCVGKEVWSWFGAFSGWEVDEKDFFIVLGVDGRPSGRAVVDMRSHETAVSTLRAMDAGRTIRCGSLDVWPFQPPRERLVLVRPLRYQEHVLGAPVERGVGTRLAPFPKNAETLAALRRDGGLRPGVGRVEGVFKLFNEDRGYGFIAHDFGEVYVHRRDCVGFRPEEGVRAMFDVVEDPRNGKTKASNVQLA